MTVECIDGRSGAPHIDGADKGRLHAGIAGERSGVMQVGKRLAATQDSANKVTIAVGDALIHGRQCSVTAPEQVTITSGTQGQRRNDLICLHYMRRASGSDYIDSAELAVLRGTPTTGTPADPTVPVGNVLNGASDDWLPLYRVSLDGVTAAKPVQVFDLLPTLQSVWDSISRMPRVITGSKSFQWVWGGNLGDLFSDSQFKAIAGRSFDNDRDVITVQNGDWSSANIPTTGTVFQQSDKKVYVAYMSAPRKNSWVRVCYAIVLGG